MLDRIGKAIKTHDDCYAKNDPDPAICDKCPIGKELSTDVGDAGVTLKFTVCGMLITIEDCMEE